MDGNKRDSLGCLESRSVSVLLFPHQESAGFLLQEKTSNASSKTDLGVLAGNIPSSSEFQICPPFQVS